MILYSEEEIAPFILAGSFLGAEPIKESTILCIDKSFMSLVDNILCILAARSELLNISPPLTISNTEPLISDTPPPCT